MFCSILGTAATRAPAPPCAEEANGYSSRECVAAGLACPLKAARRLARIASAALNRVRTEGWPSASAASMFEAMPGVVVLLNAMVGSSLSAATNFTRSRLPSREDGVAQFLNQLGVFWGQDHHLPRQKYDTIDLAKNPPRISPDSFPAPRKWVAHR